MQGHIDLLDVVEALVDIDLTIRARVIANCPTEVKPCEYIQQSFSDWANLQGGPCATITSWHMCKVSDQKTMQEFILRLEPDALAATSESSCRMLGIVIRINAHVDLISNNLRHTKCLCFSQRDIIDEAMGWVWQLYIVRGGEPGWDGTLTVSKVKLSYQFVWS
jgi:hypothetical protein